MSEETFIIIGIIVVAILACALSFELGRENVLNTLEKYGKYVDTDTTYMCVDKPNRGNNQGELEYMRPNGKKVEQ